MYSVNAQILAIIIALNVFQSRAAIKKIAHRLISVIFEKPEI